jgi:hypothetical protein
MSTRRKRTLVFTTVACLIGCGVASGSNAADDVAPSKDLPGDTAVPFWPHETGALLGTSETYVDVHADGSYFDPSIGRRVIAR